MPHIFPPEHLHQNRNMSSWSRENGFGYLAVAFAKLRGYSDLKCYLHIDKYLIGVESFVNVLKT